MIYLDSTYLFRLYFPDPGFAAVRALALGEATACAAHGQAEVLVTFHRKLREGALTPASFRDLIGGFLLEQGASAVRWLPYTPNVFDRLADAMAKLPASVFLRAADAVHLATAAEYGFSMIYSNDARLLAAAPHFGIEGRDVIGAAG